MRRSSWVYAPKVERPGEFAELYISPVERRLEVAFSLKAEIGEFAFADLVAVEHAHKHADDLFDISVQSAPPFQRAEEFCPSAPYLATVEICCGR